MPADIQAPAAPLPEQAWRRTWRVFASNRPALGALIVLMVIIFAGLVGPYLVAENPFSMVEAPLLPPGDEAFLGTDFLGRDVFTALVHGARATLLIGIAATFLTMAIGISIGAFAGYFGGLMDDGLMRVTEFFLVLPNLVFAMILTTLFSPSMWTVIFAIGIVNWCPLARLTRAEFVRLKSQEFVLASRAAGAQDMRIMMRTILPNAMPPLIVSITLLIGVCILFEAALSFLGLTDPDIMTWGLMIGASRDYFWDSPWTVAYPGLAILITVLCIALIGDGLNDAFNPKLRKR